MNFDLSTLFAGNNWIILVVVFVLFKDQIFALLGPKNPVVIPPPTPGPTPGPAPGPAPLVIPPDHPLVDAITQLLPVLLPIIEQLLKKQEPPK